MKLSNLSVGLRLSASFGAILLITALIAVSYTHLTLPTILLV